MGRRFAFYSGGTAPKDIRKAVERAIGAGLAEADAVRARSAPRAGVIRPAAWASTRNNRTSTRTKSSGTNRLSRRADEILMRQRVAGQFGFKMHTLQHVREGYKVAKEIATHGAGASTFNDWWAYKAEAYDAIPYNAAIMVRKGVLVSLKYGGLSETEALSLITINPAKQLGVDQRVGSVEPGRDADLAIFDKHRLATYAKVEKALIGGELYFDREKDLERPGRETRKKSPGDKLKTREKKKPETMTSCCAALPCIRFRVRIFPTVRC